MGGKEASEGKEDRKDEFSSSPSTLLPSFFAFPANNRIEGSMILTGSFAPTEK